GEFVGELNPLQHGRIVKTLAKVSHDNVFDFILLLLVGIQADFQQPFYRNFLASVRSFTMIRPSIVHLHRYLARRPSESVKELAGAAPEVVPVCNRDVRIGWHPRATAGGVRFRTYD